MRDALTAARAELAEAKRERDEARGYAYRKFKDFTAARAENERLREALKWYSNPEVYKPDSVGRVGDLTWKASAALSTMPAQEGSKPKQFLDLVHEIWASAQLAPSEGIEDGIERIAGLLRTSMPVTPAQEGSDNGWLPIETSPRDGTPFLGYLAKLNVPYFVCWWSTSIKTGKPYICILGIGELYDITLFPTHWRPLPPPPAQPAPEGK
jgi:hypothetical protein